MQRCRARGSLAYLVNGPGDGFAWLHGCLTLMLSRDQQSQHNKQASPHGEYVTAGFCWPQKARALAMKL